ncbi:uncharacterized protein LOC119070021 [Bradysia coprophila]|uniref:uncharacterized protein LOC119070021 n=1 Tax=Bradysia coprophila TaxID=38358 RepID=UPI00187DCCA5|nr:uncharacterized protein LOC119070021 [Bradysia coprophila]
MYSFMARQLRSIHSPNSVSLTHKNFESMEASHAPIAQEQPWNLLQKPIRVEMLTSPFSQPVFDDENYAVIRHFVGLNAEIIQILSAVMNFSSKFLYPQSIYGYAQVNGTFTGALGRLLTNKSDIGMTLFFIRDYGTRDIEFTTPIYQDQLCVVVRKAHRIPEAVLPLLTFSVTSWISFLLSFVGCSIFWMILRNVNAKRMFVASTEQLYMMNNFSDYVHIAVDTGILFVSSPLLKLPKIWSERIFVISICLMSTIIFAYFESTLATVFVNPLYLKDINTLGDLESTDFPIEIHEHIAFDPLFDSKSSLMQRIQIVGKNHQLSHIVEHGNISLVLKQTAIKFDFSHWFRLKRMHQLPDCPRTYMTAFIMPKKSVYFDRDRDRDISRAVNSAGSPLEKSVYFERINALLLRLVRSGFIQKWITDTKFNWTLESTRLHGSLDKQDYVVLELIDMEFPFYILLGGYVVGFFLFIGELCFADAIVDF